MECEIEEFSKYFNITKKIRILSNESENKSKISEDRRLEANLRGVLQKHFNISVIDDKNLGANKEFRFYQMDLFLSQTKELIYS